MTTRQQFRLETASTHYVVSTVDGSVVLDYWGPRTSAVPMWSESDRVISLATQDDLRPLEFATQGQRHTAFSELRIERPTGITGARWSLREDRTEATPHALTLEFHGEDMELSLMWRTSPDHDVIRRWVRVTNSGSDAVFLPRALSAGWNVGLQAPIRYLSGSWGREFQSQQLTLPPGEFTIGARHGVTSANFSPVVHVGHASDTGSAYGVALAWSGSWVTHVVSSTVGLPLRISPGFSDESVVTLRPGETYTAPESLGTYSGNGLNGVTDSWHAYQALEVSRSRAPVHRPIVYNSWYATTFDVSVQQQLTLAARAAELGVDTFVLDDGWFRGRTTDTAGLGDWEADPIKFPDGLGQLAEGVKSLGLDFGLWIEPECVNPDSDLYRAHPDWVYRAGPRPLELIRNQYVLDLGRDDVKQWMLDTLRQLLSTVAISYLKWDMNRPVTDGGRPGDPLSRQWSLQHTRNLYEIWATLREEFPGVVVEGCAAGGSRIDNAVLALTDVVWPSDEVGPRDRLEIQHGFLSAYPSWTMSSWVCDVDGLDDRRPVSFEYRFAVAMSGVLGIGADLSEWGPTEIKRGAELIRRYRDLRPIIHTGIVRRHGDPREPLYCLEFGQGHADDRTVAFVFDTDRDRNRDRTAPRVLLTTLRPGVTYRVEETGEETDRASAATRGVRVPFGLAVDVDILTLVPTA